MPGPSILAYDEEEEEEAGSSPFPPITPVSWPTAGFIQFGTASPEAIVNPHTQPGGLDHRETMPVVNPKETAGAIKAPSWSVMPRWVILLVGRVMAIGAAKYGAFNYRDSSISASTYQDAMERHAQLWFDGEDDDPETGVSHLASIIASCSLLLDAQASGKLDDNRQKTGRAREVLDALDRMATPSQVLQGLKRSALGGALYHA